MNGVGHSHRLIPIRIQYFGMKTHSQEVADLFHGRLRGGHEIFETKPHLPLRWNFPEEVENVSLTHQPVEFSQMGVGKLVRMSEEELHPRVEVGLNGAAGMTQKMNVKWILEPRFSLAEGFGVEGIVGRFIDQ